MGRIGAIVAAALTLCATSAWPQTIYQSRGKNGVAVYSDRPPADGKIEKTFVYEYLPSSTIGAPPSGGAVATQRPSRSDANGAISAPANAGNVTLYGASWCPYCRRARAYLAQHGVAFAEVDIDTPSGRYAYDVAGGRSGIPLLIVGNRRVQGFSQSGYDAIFVRR